MNIIDVLSTAYNKLIHKIGLIVIPIGIDLFIWLGPKISIALWIQKLITQLQAAIQGASSVFQTESTVLVSQALGDIQTTFSGLNMMSLLAWGRVGVPSVAGILPITPDTKLVIPVSTDLQLVTVCIALLAIGLLIACIFIGLISQVVKGERVAWGAVLKQAPTHWLTLTVIYIPLIIMTSILVMIGTLLGPLAFLIIVGILWMLLYLYFVPQAVIMGDASPMEAIRNSFIVVRTSFWPSLGFIILTNVISGGFTYIWSHLVGSPVGIVVAIVLNAVVGTGLLIASCIFFQDRLQRWYQMQQQAKIESSNGK